VRGARDGERDGEGEREMERERERWREMEREKERERECEEIACIGLKIRCITESGGQLEFPIIKHIILETIMAGRQENENWSCNF
jgi:hypothetical protein